MKNMILKIIALILTISCFMVLAIASGDNNDPPAREVGRNGQADRNADAPEEVQANVDERFVLGDTAVFRDLRITADEIIINETWQDELFRVFEPADGNKFVAVRFTIENISDEHQLISSMLLFDAYVDGTLLAFTFGATTGLEGTLDGEIAPGRRMIGFYGVEISASANELELEVRPTWLAGGRNRAMFVFNLAEVESVR